MGVWSSTMVSWDMVMVCLGIVMVVLVGWGAWGKLSMTTPGYFCIPLAMPLSSSLVTRGGGWIHPGLTLGLANIKSRGVPKEASGTLAVRMVGCLG